MRNQSLKMVKTVQFVAFTLCFLALAQTQANVGANCRLDWNHDGVVNMDDLYTADYKGYYWAWWVLINAPHVYHQYFGHIDPWDVDYNNDGNFDIDDILSETPPYGIYTEYLDFLNPDPEVPFHDKYPESQCLHPSIKSCKFSWLYDPGVCFESIGSGVTQKVPGMGVSIMEMGCTEIEGQFSDGPCDQNPPSGALVGMCVMMPGTPMEQREYYFPPYFNSSTGFNRCRSWDSDNEYTFFN